MKIGLTRGLAAAATAFAIIMSLATPPASAQVPSFTPPPLQPSTFMSGFSFAAPQTGAGDLFCIAGSATRLTKIKAIQISGIKTTAQFAAFSLIKRSTADTGGTSTAPTGVPIDSQQVVTTATATVKAYTVVPTPGTAVGTLSSRYLGLFTTAGSAADRLDYSWSPSELFSDLRLRSATESLCLNAPAAFTTDGPTLSVEITWTEQ